jgi:hypothetical protein
MKTIGHLVDKIKSRLHWEFMSAADINAYAEMAYQIRTELERGIATGESCISIKPQKPEHITDSSWQSAGKQLILDTKVRAFDKVKITIENVPKDSAPRF